jgi:hypothetical protein
MHALKYFVICGTLLVVLQLPHGCWQNRQKTHLEEVIKTPSKKANDTTPPFTVISEQARLALILPCGRCHQSTLDTHKPGAVAVFDLDAGDLWHTNLDEGKLNGLDSRTKNKAGISEEERVQIAEFVALKRTQLQ